MLFTTVKNSLQRVRLEEEVNGNYLVLGQVSPEDTGLYTCQVSAYKPTQLTHSLSVRGEE